MKMEYLRLALNERPLLRSGKGGLNVRKGSDRYAAIRLPLVTSPDCVLFDVGGTLPPWRMPLWRALVGAQ